jgi:uncharacterized protein (TIGR02186 family)
MLLLATLPATAQELVSGLSQDQIEINSSYAGTSIVVFGAIEGTQSETSSVKDVIVVVRGPDTDMVIRRKARIAGVWINSDQMKLTGMPAYYYLASSGPLSKIASAQTLARYQLGLAYVTPQSMSKRSFAKSEPFRIAAISERAHDGLYGQAESVEFLSYSLFRVHVPIPATVPRGEYTVEAYLFRDGTVISAQSTPLFIDQKGLERRLYGFAHSWPFFYGLSAVLGAMLFGWLSSLMIRQPR